MAKVQDYDMPDDLYYHKEHCWARVESPDCVRVGLNDFAQAQAGDITYIDLPFEGDEAVKNETCGKMQSSKWIGKLIAPVSGEITEVNLELENQATLVNEDPYGKGWILAIKPTKLDEELKGLCKGDAAVAWLEAEIVRVEKEKTEGKDYAKE